MVDESSNIAAPGRVNNCVRVDLEQVRTADANLRVLLFADVCHNWSHLLTNVLNDHLICRDILQRKQAPVVDSTLGEFELLLAELQRERVIRGRRRDLGGVFTLSWLNLSRSVRAESTVARRRRWLERASLVSCWVVANCLARLVLSLSLPATCEYLIFSWLSIL